MGNAHLKDIIKCGVVETRRHSRQVIVRVIALLCFTSCSLSVSHECTVHVGAHLLKMTPSVFDAANVAANMQS